MALIGYRDIGAIQTGGLDVGALQHQDTVASSSSATPARTIRHRALIPFLLPTLEIVKKLYES